MKRAILAIAPDAKQRRILDQVLPSWKSYSARHNLPIVIIEKSITGGKHPYWDRWLTVSRGEPEVRGYDQLLLLDNDVFITKQAPDIFAHAGSGEIAAAAESVQQKWKPNFIPRYYRSFHVEMDPRCPQPDTVVNFGVTVVSKEMGPVINDLYQKWQETVRPRFTAEELAKKGIFYRLEADGPFMSYELQARSLVTLLANEFNYFFPIWLRDNHHARWPFLVQAKLMQKLGHTLAAPLIRSLSAPARRAVREAAKESYFLHFAASKSPLWLVSSPA